MKIPRFTLVTDGRSDGEMLVPILEWLLRAHCRSIGVKVVHADTSQWRDRPKRLENKIAFALKAYPCDLLFIHRDAEGQAPDWRRREIEAAIEPLSATIRAAHVCVVPIRMTEAWLLFGEAAIRWASSNPNGQVHLNIPPLSKLEDQPDPKQSLHDLLIAASELSGRRRKSFDPQTKVHLVAERLDDFSPLRQLPAFRELESDVQRIVRLKEWNSP